MSWEGLGALDLGLVWFSHCGCYVVLYVNWQCPGSSPGDCTACGALLPLAIDIFIPHPNVSSDHLGDWNVLLCHSPP